ncbi:hypothetical protein ACEQPO_16890 [Bacillus sp. SL00103]
MYQKNEQMKGDIQHLWIYGKMERMKKRRRLVLREKESNAR